MVLTHTVAVVVKELQAQDHLMLFLHQTSGQKRARIMVTQTASYSVLMTVDLHSLIEWKQITLLTKDRELVFLMVALCRVNILLDLVIINLQAVGQQEETQDRMVAATITMLTVTTWIH